MGHDYPVNAAERFLAASRSQDLDAGRAELAPDVVMLNPATDDPLVGQDAVAGALMAVAAACDEFRHTHLLEESGNDDGGRLFGLVFEATIGEARLTGVDLIELNTAGQISRFSVAVRPVSALAALGARMSAPPS